MERKRCLGSLALAATILGLSIDSVQAEEDPFSLLDEPAKPAKKADDDPFAMLDGPSEQKSGPSFLDKLYDNSELKLFLRGWSFFEEPEDRQGVDTREHYYQNRLELSTNYRAGDHLVNFKGWGEFGNEMASYKGATDGFKEQLQERRYFHLDEFHWVWGLGSADFTLGKKSYKTGLSTLYTPTDRISPTDGIDPLNPKRLGTWMIGLDYYVGSATWTLLVLPFFTPAKVPDSTSRWYTNEAALSPALATALSGADGDIVEEYPDAKLENTQAFFKHQSTYKGWDWFLAAYNGFSKAPVLKQEIQLTGNKFTKEHIRVAQASGGFSTTSGPQEFHGEWLGSFAFGNRDEHYVTYVIGTTYTFDTWTQSIGFEKIDVTGEYGGEQILEEQLNRDYVRSSKDFRFVRNDLLWKVEMKYNEDLYIAYAGQWEMGPRQGYSNIIGGRYKVADGFITRANVQMFQGNKNSDFGRWKKNWRAVGEVEYTF